MIAFLVALAVGSPLPPPEPPCRIPKHALVVGVAPRVVVDSEIAIYDRDDGSRVCKIELPRETQPDVTVASDGRIFVALHAAKETNYTTDTGHVDVIGPDGRLLHRLNTSVAGVSDIASDSRGHVFVSTGSGSYLNGESVSAAGGLAMYDAASMALVRTFGIEPKSFHGQFALSGDGRTLAAMLDSEPSGPRIDIFDAITGKRTLEIPAPGASYAAFDGANLLVRTRSNSWQARSTLTGAIVATPTMDGWDPPKVFKGVSYESRYASQTSLVPSATIIRRESASGRVLPPIAITGTVFALFPVDPDPSLASAVAGLETAAPSFPSLTQLSESLPKNAPGLQFDDAVSGKRFTYLGNYARVDDPRAHALTIVDCTRRVALIAKTLARSYRVLRMDATTTDEHGPPDAYISRLTPPASVTLEFKGLHRPEFRSPLATMGYETTYAFAPGGPAQPADVLNEEQEYSSGIAAVHPWCAKHSFDGEPLEIEPRVIHEAPSASFVNEAFPSGIVRIVGAQPPIPTSSLRVRVEVGHNERLAPVFDATRVHSVAPAEVTQFAIPGGYTKDVSLRY